MVETDKIKIKEAINFLQKDKEDQLLEKLIELKNKNKEKIVRGIKKTIKEIVANETEKKNLKLVLAKNITPLDSFSHLFLLAIKNNVEILMCEDKKFFTKFLEKTNKNSVRKNEECE